MMFASGGLVVVHNPDGTEAHLGELVDVERPLRDRALADLPAHRRPAAPAVPFARRHPAGGRPPRGGAARPDLPWSRRMVRKPPPAPDDWEVLAVEHVVDGDTVDLRVRRPIGVLDNFTIEATGVIRVRAVHLDTPERGEHGHDEAMADLADWVHGWEAAGLRVTTQGRDSFGRYLGDVYRSEDRAQTLSDFMVRDRHWPVWIG